MRARVVACSMDVAGLGPVSPHERRRMSFFAPHGREMKRIIEDELFDRPDFALCDSQGVVLDKAQDNKLAIEVSPPSLAR